VNDQKETNPKDLVATSKVPLHLWPRIATAIGSLAMLDGALKYGRENFRVSGVRVSTYYAACLRHLAAWYEGEECAPDSGVPHLGHALACIAIILDARAAGKLNDDRAYPAGYNEAVAQLNGIVENLRVEHADKSPRHFSIGDADHA
jgi:hypothetical protein